MSKGREWREFNSAWRDRAGEKAFDVLVAISGTLILSAEQVFRRLEPLSILHAAVALVVSIYTFQIEHEDRKVERRLRAWDIVTSDGPYSGGKAEAVAFLLGRGRDLSGAKLANVQWGGADLTNHNFSNADLSGAFLLMTKFDGASLGGPISAGQDFGTPSSEVPASAGPISAGPISQTPTSRGRFSLTPSFANPISLGPNLAKRLF